MEIDMGSFFLGFGMLVLWLSGTHFGKYVQKTNDQIKVDEVCARMQAMQNELEREGRDD